MISIDMVFSSALSACSNNVWKSSGCAGQAVSMGLRGTDASMYDCIHLGATSTACRGGEYWKYACFIGIRCLPPLPSRGLAGTSRE